MPYMELRSTFTASFFLFLILAFPFYSRGESEALHSEIYEIDYRGPETHSAVPPPHHSRGKLHSTPQKSSVTAPNALASTSSAQSENKVKKVHG
ncbi:uncharacterized protein LOC133295718 [Gastrolobium bilobum]|uniref:uncharacterized protein LOC133295718 n=1 Tax=Gastrolobium bilobum TaxID=150636 RepID=UPI002AAF0B7C|nr:uncharacterized protein LOC133295718 [Gastrolobium bilobum]